jgi:RNA polymerase sigma-70 factor (ECF subfamily)
MEDAALVQQVLAGDTEAYAELVDRWAGRVLALCHARVADAALAEELAEEALLRGLEEIGTLVNPDRLGPWLAHIAAHVCRDWLSARQNSLAPDDPGPDELLAAVEALPGEARTLLMLHHYHDATYRDLARLLDVSTATVTARLARARALLRAGGHRDREGG